MPAPHLSKSRYLAGRRCALELWQIAHHPELADPPGSMKRALLEMGAEVGRTAHALFPGGVLVEGPHAEALARTQALLADARVPALFEAAFEHRGVRVRVDVLERLADGRFGLREVKSATRMKDDYPHDLAVQHWVLTTGCGLEVPSAELVRVNRDYVRGAAGVEPSQFFTRQDMTEQVVALAPEVARNVSALSSMVAGAEAPRVEPGGGCNRPHPCRFWGHCTREKPRSWQLGLRKAKRSQPDIWRRALESGRLEVSAALASRLAETGPPVWSLDFETLGNALPLYPGTRPFQMIAFQWSLHHLAADGAVRHWEFLADGRVDPRAETAERLLDVLSHDDAPVLAYGALEGAVLRNLAEQVPERRKEVEQIGARVVNLLPIVQECAYHPGFEASYSLKDVAPVLAPTVRYDALDEVAEGLGAASAFAHIAAGELEPEQEARVREALLAYCKLDTEALLEVHRALREAAAGTGAGTGTGTRTGAV